MWGVKQEIKDLSFSFTLKVANKSFEPILMVAVDHPKFEMFQNQICPEPTNLTALQA